MKTPWSRLFTRLILLVALAAAAALLWTGSHQSLRAAEPQFLGQPLPHLSALESTMFNRGQVPMSETWDFRHGLGPVFTQDSCATCHANPVIGGNSTEQTVFFGTLNSDGSFNPLTGEGGMLLQPNSVSEFHSSCPLSGEVIPGDATIVASHLTPQVFGMGLIDSIPDSAILKQAVDKGMGVKGIANMVPDENGNIVVGKFGYKAQLATILQTVANTLAHDVGVTNPIVPAEDLPQGQSIPPGCSITTEPNDDGSQMMDAYHYLLYLAPNPPPGNPNQHGEQLFTSVGCALCHLPRYKTGANIQVPVNYGGRTITSKALSNQPVELYSDLLLHDMGTGLADGLPLFQATASMFRTTPLWGLSTRIASKNGLLHDGRASDVATAILDHGGEASQVVGKFRTLSPSDQADLIAFVSSL